MDVSSRGEGVKTFLKTFHQYKIFTCQVLQNAHSTLHLGMSLMDCTLLNKGMIGQQAEG